MPFLTTAQVVLGLDGVDRDGAIERLVDTLVSTGRCLDSERLCADLAERERDRSTAQPGGIAIPHARCGAVTRPSLVFGRSSEGIAWGAPDGPSDLIFLIAVPADDDSHLQLLARLSRTLMDLQHRTDLRAAQTPAEVVRLLDDDLVVGGSPVTVSLTRDPVCRTVRVASRIGLHARPAAQFVRVAREAGIPITICRPGQEPVDATSILGVMALGARFGEELILCADGTDADQVVDRLVQLLATDLDAR